MKKASKVVLLGAPLERTSGLHSGTAEAPGRIRWLLNEAIETFSLALGRDWGEIEVLDRGDLPLAKLATEKALASIEKAAARAVKAGLLILLGGEHTVTLGAVQGVRKVHQDLAVLHIDAHLDLLDEYEGERLSRATVFRRIGEEIGFKSIAQVGIRSGTAEEVVLSQECLLSSPRLELPPWVRGALEGRPVYVSLDIDVLDPAYAPGVAWPEPGGATTRELFDFLYTLADLNVVALDITEVTPAADHGDLTSLTAAKLVREMALLFTQDEEEPRGDEGPYRNHLG